MLNRLVAAARQADVTRIIGVYLPTAKNALVKEHYRKLGFELLTQEPDGRSTWKLDIATYVERIVPMVAFEQA